MAMISSWATRSPRPEGRNFSTQGIPASCSGCAAGCTAALPLLRGGWVGGVVGSAGRSVGGGKARGTPRGGVAEGTGTEADERANELVAEREQGHARTLVLWCGCLEGLLARRILPSLLDHSPGGLGRVHLHRGRHPASLLAVLAPLGAGWLGWLGCLRRWGWLVVGSVVDGKGEEDMATASILERCMGGRQEGRWRLLRAPISRTCGVGASVLVAAPSH